MKTDKRLEIIGEAKELIKEWFAFVDTSQRTNVDIALGNRFADFGTNSVTVNTREAQMLVRWYHLVPNIIKDRKDEEIANYLQHFTEMK